MNTTSTEHDATLWFANDVPVRMLYAGVGWRVTDIPTRLTAPIWELPLDGPRRMFGWRFQGTSETDETLVFDVYRDESSWHVHRAYS